MGVFRFFVMALGCYLHAYLSEIDLLNLPEGKGKLVFLRAAFGWASAMASFIAIFFLPLSIAVVLYYT